MTDWTVFAACEYANCPADVGQPCLTKSGDERDEPHANRERLAETLESISTPRLQGVDPERFLKPRRVAEHLREHDDVMWSSDAKDELLGYLMTAMDEIAAKAAERTRELDDKKTVGEKEMLDAIAFYEVLQR